MEDEWSRKNEPLVSGVLVEDIDEDELTEYEKVQKREAPDRGFYQETQQMILDLHNVYRSNVTPPASNMAHMVSGWNTKIIESNNIYIELFPSVIGIRQRRVGKDNSI